MSSSNNDQYDDEGWVSAVRQEVWQREQQIDADEPQQPGRKKRKTSNDRKTLHPLTTTGNKDIQKYLNLVPDGIKDALERVGLPFDDATKEYITQSKAYGHYPFILPEECGYAEHLLSAKHRSQLGIAQKIKQIEQDLNIYIRKASPRFASTIRPNTGKNYEQQCRSLWFFLAYLGAYDQMIVLLPNVPQLEDNVIPSITPDTIKEFIMHRYNQTGSQLFKGGDETLGPLTDCFGTPILCEGSVNNYKWFDSALAAFSYVHKKAKKEESFKPSCSACRSLLGDEPCPAHRGGGKTRIHYARTKGDPVDSMTIRELRKWLEEESKRRKYKVSRRSPFLPHDFTLFHANLRSRCFDIVHLMYYTALLDSIKLGSRWDSYHTVKISDFDETSRFWVVLRDGRFTNFAQQIKEKSDKEVTVYRIHFDDHMKQRCLARHLLVYLHCSGISSGFLFPHHNELLSHRESLLANHEAKGEAKNPMDYDHFNSHVRFLKTLVKGGDYANWGPHSPRLTNYLWSFIGGADLELAAKACRHKSSSMALQYLQDSASIRDLLKDHPKLRELHKVSPFRDDIVVGNGQNMERALMELPNRTRQCKSILEICRILVEDMLHVDPDDDNYYNPQYLLERSYEVDLETQIDTVEDPLTTQIKSVVPPNRQYGLLSTLDMVRKEDKEQVSRALMQRDVAYRALQRAKSHEATANERTKTLLDEISRLRDEKLAAERALQEKDSSYRELQKPSESHPNTAVRDFGLSTPGTATQPTDPIEERDNDNSSNNNNKNPNANSSVTPSPRGGHLAGTDSSSSLHVFPAEESQNGQEPARRAIYQQPGHTQVPSVPPLGRNLHNQTVPEQTARKAIQFPANEARRDETTANDHASIVSPCTANAAVAAITLQEDSGSQSSPLTDTNPPRNSVVQVPPASIPLVDVSVVGEVTRIAIKQTTRDVLKTLKGKERAKIIVDLIAALIGAFHPVETPGVLNADTTNLASYEKAIKILYKTAQSKQEKNVIANFVKRNLTPVYHHFLVCCSGSKKRFLSQQTDSFGCKNFLLNLNCNRCDEHSWTLAKKSTRNAKAMAGMDEQQARRTFLDGLKRARK